MFNVAPRKSARRIAVVFIALTALFGSSSQAEAGLLGPSSDYIVQITPAARAAVETAIKNAGGTVNGRFQYAFDGFVIKLPDLLLPVLKKIPNILTIEKDQPVSGLAIQQNEIPTPSWGLDRIDQREVVSTAAGYQGNYGYRSAGAGSTIYIGDTGIYPHEDLAGRISSVGFTGIQDGNGTVDCNGHGTHVATTAAGTKYGVAKNAKVVPVRILNCAGSGSYATVIAGLDWILSPLNTNSKTQAVLNLSIGGTASSTLNEAILRLTNAGIVVVAAAGNESTDACTRSPASAPTAITVGATNSNDSKASYSNSGPCVDIFAPGSGITAGWITSPSATNNISGTSMATPHVTGAAAVFLGLNPSASVAQVSGALVEQATKGAVTGLAADTANNFLYVSPTDGGPVITPPAVQVATVTGITHQQAQANVEINPNNAPTTASIEYSTDATFATIEKSINLTPTPLEGGAVISLPVIFDKLLANTMYYFRAKANNESGSYVTPVGNFRTLVPPTTPPVPSILPASVITGWSAKLNGVVNPNYGVTTVSFVYGTDPLFLSNSQTTLGTPPSLSGGITSSVSVDVSFLNPATKYYFKVVASNSAATVQSAVESFTTTAISGVAPSVETTRWLVGFDAPTATITGKINPNGQTTSVRLVYGTEQTLTVGQRTVTLPNTYTGIDTVTVSADMTSLLPGIRYFYRFEASNASGVTKPVALVGVTNPITPVIVNTLGSNQTTTSMTLQTTVNPGGSNSRIYFIYGTDPKLETGTTVIQGNPFAIIQPLNYSVTAPLTGLSPNTTYYFRTKVQVYTGPLLDKGGILLGPISSAQTLIPPRNAQFITFNTIASRTFIGEPTELVASSTSGLPVTFTTTTPSICQIQKTDSATVLAATTPIPGVSSAQCMVAANQAGNDQFSAATAVTRAITFAKEVQTITFTNPTSKEINTQNPLVISTNSGLALTVTSLTPQTCSVLLLANGTYVAQADPSVKGDLTKCTIQATQAGDDRWAAATAQSRTFTWVRAFVSLKGVYASAITAAGTNFDVSILDRSAMPVSETLTGTVALTFATLTPNFCTVDSPSYIGASGVHTRALVKAIWNGSCQIKVTFSGNDFLQSSTVTASVGITGLTTPGIGANAAQIITFAQPASSVAMGTNVALTATASSGLYVTISTSTPSICSVALDANNRWIATSASGLTGDANVCQLQATQAGDNRWAPAQTVLRSFKYTRLAQAITFILPSSRFYGGAPTKLTATSSSGLPLSFTTTTPAVCQIQLVDSISVLSYVSPISANTSAACYVVASQGGSGTYLPAPAVTKGIVFMKESTAIKGTWSSAISPAGTSLDLAVTSASQPTLNEQVGGTAALVVTSRTPSICQVVSADYIGSSTVHTRTTVKAMWNGTCQLTINFTGNSYWLPSTIATSTSVSGMTAPAQGANAIQTIGFSLPSTIPYSMIYTLTSVTSSKLPVTYTATTPLTCTVSTTAGKSTVQVVAGLTGTANLCTIQASQQGDGAWAPAVPVLRSFTWK